MNSSVQNPGLPQTQSGLSALFSLSDAAASVRPIATATSPSATATPVSSHTLLPAEAGVEEASVKTRSSSRAKEAGHKDLASGKNSAHSHALKHRRISSTSQARRRMSDAREAVSVAAIRPSPASFSSSSALEALSALSLSQSHGHQASTPVSAPASHNLHSHASPIQRGRSHTALTNVEGAQLASSQPINIVIGSSQSKGHSPSASRSLGISSTLVGSISSSLGEDLEGEELDDFEEGDRASSVVPDGATGKKGRALKVRKRGTIFQCESCSKVYRHPSCLVKHRWEHSPHWREASKFMYSKHQQVQLLEAATILSHLDPVTSLPEDRSHWPSFVSNGLLPPPSEANLAGMNPSLTTVSPSTRMASFGNRQSTPVSSSVPNGTLYPRSGVSVGISHPPSSKSPSSSIGLPSSGPRMSQFSVPTAQAGGITFTQVRPGLIAHTTGSATPPPPVLLPIPPALPQVAISSSVPAQSQLKSKQVFAGAGMTVSPYADEELADEQGSDESHSEDGERIKVEPEDEDTGARFGTSKAHSIAGVSFNGYRSQDDGGANVLPSLAYSADSNVLGANGLSTTSASMSASAGGWSSSLPRSEAREDSVSISGSGSPRTRSRSRSMTRSRSNSAEFEHYSAGSGRGHGGVGSRNGFDKYEADGMEVDDEDEIGGEERVRVGVGKGVRKEREREREEEEGWVDMDMDM